MKKKVRITDDKELLSEINKQLKENNGHCPCQLDFESDDTLCPCISFKNLLKTTTACGEYECSCGKYIINICGEEL